MGKWGQGDKFHSYLTLQARIYLYLQSINRWLIKSHLTAEMIKLFRDGFLF